MVIYMFRTALFTPYVSIIYSVYLYNISIKYTLYRCAIASKITGERRESDPTRSAVTPRVSRAIWQTDRWITVRTTFV